MKRRARLRIVLGVLGAALAVTVAIACGSDDGNGPESCTGAACDGGSESSTTDGPAADTSVTDGGGGDAGADADSSIPVSCGEGVAGTLDPTFGDGGVVWLYDTYGATSVSYLADGKILVAGRLAAPQLAVVRLRHDGSLDPAFGDAGIAAFTVGTASRSLDAVATQADGKILAAGTARFGSATPYMIVVRLETNGALDSTFGDAGVVVSSFGGAAWGLAPTPDGRLLVSGQTVDYELLRLNADGKADVTFGVSGRATADIRGTNDYPGWLTPVPGNRYVVSGGSDTTPASNVADFSFARFNDDGGLDTAFGDAGKVVVALGSNSAVSGVAVQSDGRLVAGGGTASGAGAGDFATVRLTPSGGTDSTFGDAGVVTTDFGGQTDGVIGIAVMPDGKIVAVGQSITIGPTPDTRIALVRYMADGRLDTSFGTGGTVRTPSFGLDTSTEVHAVAFRGCEAIAVGQWDTPLRNHPVMGVARFTLGP